MKHKLGVLILHGFTSSLDCVKGIEQALQPLGLPTRMPLLLGHGAASPRALRGVTWQHWLEDAETALQELLTEADKVVVCGHSMGGLLALNLAARHGPGIDSAIAAAASIKMRSPLAPGGPLHFLTPLVKRLVKSWNIPPVYADKHLQQFHNNYPWAPTDAIASVFEFAGVSRGRLGEIDVPLLILQSRSDSIVDPRSADIIYAETATPGSDKQIVWFEKTDHEMFRDCERQAAAQVIVDFVRQRHRLAG